MSATKRNAQTIEHLTDCALTQLMEARIPLAEALGCARNDYDYNADDLANIQGAFNLLLHAVVVENLKWRDYARNRVEESKLK